MPDNKKEKAMNMSQESWPTTIEVTPLYVALKSLPTLGTSQTHDLKVDTGKLRVWISRMSPEDYDSSLGYLRELLQIEAKGPTGWVPLINCFPASGDCLVDEIDAHRDQDFSF